jgi:diguanylate cyclase
MVPLSTTSEGFVLLLFSLNFGLIQGKATFGGVLTTLAIHYRFGLVIVSVLISMAGAFVALSLADRMHAAVRSSTRRLWLAFGSVAMGIGIWSMHYLGMLAVKIPVPVFYHWPTVVLSLLMAIGASFAALETIGQTKLGFRRLFCGSLLMAAGIGGMHYIGMAAMRSTAMEHYNYWVVALSIVAAAGFSWLALWIGFAVRDSEERAAGILRAGGGCAMGLGIASMHYIAMSGATFSVCAIPFSMTHTVTVNLLGQAGIATMTILILLAALGFAALEKSRFLVMRDANAKLEAAQQALLDANELLSAMSNIDGLTGLSNRRHFDIMLDTEWNRAVRKMRSISALMIDVDRFKSVNDRYGHQRGDECLRQIADVLLHPQHRAYDCVARYGGEEFVVLLPETDIDDAVRIAESICEAVRELKFENLGAVGDIVTVSIGVSSRTPNREDNVQSFLAAADCALYEAKHSGRDRVKTCCKSTSLCTSLVCTDPLLIAITDRCQS